MVHFLIVLFISLLFFALLLYKADFIKSESSRMSNLTIWNVFMVIYKVMLVNYSYSFSGNFLMWFLIGLSIFEVIVMLNLLISIISDTFN